MGAGCLALFSIVVKHTVIPRQQNESSMRIGTFKRKLVTNLPCLRKPGLPHLGDVRILVAAIWGPANPRGHLGRGMLSSERGDQRVTLLWPHRCCEDPEHRMSKFLQKCSPKALGPHSWGPSRSGELAVACPMDGRPPELAIICLSFRRSDEQLLCCDFPCHLQRLLKPEAGHMHTQGALPWCPQCPALHNPKCQ